MYSSAVACLKLQLERRLKEVDLETYEVIQVIETLKSCMGVIAAISHQPTHYWPVLLLNVRIVVFLVGAGTGEFNAIPRAVVVEPVVYEFTPIIRVQAEERKWKACSHMVDSCPNPLLPFIPHSLAFYPSRGHIHHAQCGEIESPKALSTVSYRISFQKPGVIPVQLTKDTYWDRCFE